jgi:hypothetical protein
MNKNTTLRNTLQAALLTATLLLGISAAQAQLVTNNIAVQNFSFETPVTSDYVKVAEGSGPNALSNYGWQGAFAPNNYVVANGGGTVNYSSGVVGNQTLFMEPWLDGTPETSPMVWQNLGEGFAAGTYNLSVNVGQASGYATLLELATAEFQLAAFTGSGSGPTSLNYNLGVAATSVLVKDYYGYLNTFNYTLTLNGTESFIGQEIAIVLKANRNGSWQQNVSFDNVQLTYVAVPEPSTYALVVGGIATLLLIRRRVQA